MPVLFYLIPPALALYYLSYWPVWVEVRVHRWFAFYSFCFLYTYSSSVVLIVNASLLVETQDIRGCCNLRRFIVHRYTSTTSRL
ncbi:hypothetical protein PLICRDRAFT_483386 [Plicaturopsis crispa FD-325 SS-3]|nr:hypothetical protein PLICRDRAFT_483386 [Plicaturopsis crispa FD-325 SS-3]